MRNLMTQDIMQSVQQLCHQVMLYCSQPASYVLVHMFHPNECAEELISLVVSIVAQVVHDSSTTQALLSSTAKGVCHAGAGSKQRQPAQPSADDRFGEWDIITGKRVRDLRLEPVLQLAQWQQSLFGSRESTSGSLDEETQERER